MLLKGHRTMETAFSIFSCLFPLCRNQCCSEESELVFPLPPFWGIFYAFMIFQETENKRMQKITGMVI